VKKIIQFTLIVFCLSTYGQKPSLEQLNKAINKAKEHQFSNESIARLYWEQGKYLSSKGLHKEGVESFQQGLKLLRPEYADSIQIVGLLNLALGEAMIAVDQYELAIPYLTKAEVAFEERQDVKLRAQVLANQGIVHEKTGALDLAIRSQKQSLDLFEAVEDQEGIAQVQEHLGSIYEDLDQWNRADSLFSLSYQYWKGSSSPTEVNILNNLGDIERKQNRPESSLIWTRKALEIAEKLDLQYEKESGYKDLAKGFDLLGWHDSAYYYLKKSRTIHDLLVKRHNTDQLNALHTLYNTQLKESEIELLKEQNKAQKEEEFFLLLGLFLVVIFGFIGLRLQRKRNIAELKQRAYKEELFELQLHNRKQSEALLKREVELKTSSLSRYSLHLAQKNKLLANVAMKAENMAKRKALNHSKLLKEMGAELRSHLNQEDEWSEFQQLFSEIHPRFIKELNALVLEPLGPSEMRLAMLLRLNLSNKEIASVLHISPDSVRVARYRFRKKLPLSKEQNLVHFLLAIGLHSSLKASRVISSTIQG
jgi:tetratricopeptide (TPR) repeat protein